MRDIFTVQDGWGIQCFSTWRALSKYLFVLRGRFANQPNTGYKNGLFFDTDNPTSDRDSYFPHGTPATSHRVKKVLDAGFQCTLVDGADSEYLTYSISTPHPHHIVITKVPLYTVNDMDAHWHHLSAQNTEDS